MRPGCFEGPGPDRGTMPTWIERHVGPSFRFGISLLILVATGMLLSVLPTGRSSPSEGLRSSSDVVGPIMPGPGRLTGGSRRSGRGISEVTATVLLVIITLAIAGVVYVFLTVYFGTIP